MKRDLFAELKRRNVFRAGAFYLAAAWLLAQIATQILPVFDVPASWLRWLIAALAIGFPFWIAFAWFYEWTPQGLRRESEIGPAQPAAGRGGRALDRWIIAILAAAVVLLLANTFVWRKGAGLAEAGGGTAVPEKSIAVLPFANMSADPAQEYFSDGIAEELLNRLAQSTDLQVAARTSAFQFKGRNVSMTRIGHELRVANVLEGSVRKAGARLRITAQLINAESGYQLWSHTYERDAGDIFKVQDEIASAIAGALEAKLGGRPAATAEERIDPAAYDDYLLARRHLALRVGDNLHLAADAFTRAIARAPDYAPAYSGRAFAVTIGLGWKGWMSEADALAAADADVAKALALDPDAAEAYMVRGILDGVRLRSAAALADMEHALKLAPGNVDVQNFAGDFFENVGALRRAEALKRQAMALDPLAFVHPMNLATILDDQGRYAEAIVMGERAVALQRGAPTAEPLFLARLHAGDIGGARHALEMLCADVGEAHPGCRIFRALLLARTGQAGPARDLVQAAAHQATDESLASVLGPGLGDYAAAARHVTAEFGSVVWLPTRALLEAPGGAKLPEELSRDPAWLDAWNDPRARELMTLYRANIAAFRRGE